MRNLVNFAVCLCTSESMDISKVWKPEVSDLISLMVRGFEYHGFTCQYVQRLYRLKCSLLFWLITAHYGCITWFTSKHIHEVCIWFLNMMSKGRGFINLSDCVTTALFCNAWADQSRAPLVCVKHKGKLCTVCFVLKLSKRCSWWRAPWFPCH